MGDLQHHPRVGVGNTSKAQNADGHACGQHIDVVKRNWNLAKLPVFSSSNKKNVKTLTQYSLSLVIESGYRAGFPRRKPCIVCSGTWPRSRSGQTVRSYKRPSPLFAGTTFRLQSKPDTALSPVNQVWETDAQR